MNKFDKAINFATAAHSGQTRKMSTIPYILHPFEVASIISTMTSDEDTIIAGFLHDTVEDCNVLPETIREEFGSRVFQLVLSETEDKLSDLPPEATWKQRKEESIIILEHTKDIQVKILWLSDKLSNVRSFAREYMKTGNKMWNNFHQKDPKEQEWYYRSIIKNLTELKDTAAYMELETLINYIFG